MYWSLLPRNLLLWVLTPLVAIASLRWMVIDLNTVMPHVVYHWEWGPTVFFMHVGLAPVALLLVPFQFWSNLRKRRPRLHRWLGRLYAVSILLSGVAGLIMGINTEAGIVASWGFICLAVVWLLVTGNAVRLAIQRQISRHKTWMIRSAALTMAAVTLRVYLPGLAWGFGFETGYTIVAWLCWVPNMIVAEWLIARDPTRRRAVPAQ